jgi:hypothetical protein
MKKKNPTLTKNMSSVKWKSIPPLKGPDPQNYFQFLKTKSRPKK